MNCSLYKDICNEEIEEGLESPRKKRDMKLGEAPADPDFMGMSDPKPKSEDKKKKKRRSWFSPKTKEVGKINRNMSLGNGPELPSWMIPEDKPVVAKQSTKPKEGGFRMGSVAGDDIGSRRNSFSRSRRNSTNSDCSDTEVNYENYSPRSVRTAPVIKLSPRNLEEHNRRYGSARSQCSAVSEYSPNCREALGQQRSIRSTGIPENYLSPKHAYSNGSIRTGRSSQSRGMRSPLYVGRSPSENLASVADSMGRGMNGISQQPIVIINQVPRSASPSPSSRKPKEDPRLRDSPNRPRYRVNPSNFAQRDLYDPRTSY